MRTRHKRKATVSEPLDRQFKRKANELDVEATNAQPADVLQEGLVNQHSNEVRPTID